jgi:hypothetical protein
MRPWHQIALATDQVRPVVVGEEGGKFLVRSPVDRHYLQVVASNGLGWDHVSVSRRERSPTWAELEHVKRLFFEETEVAMQLHLPPADHISIHPYCLHLWRPQAVPIPMPEKFMV